MGDRKIAVSEHFYVLYFSVMAGSTISRTREEKEGKEKQTLCFPPHPFISTKVRLMPISFHSSMSQASILSLA